MREADARSALLLQDRALLLASAIERRPEAMSANDVPLGFSLEKMLRAKLPLDWSEQQKCLGFDAQLR